MKIVSNGISKRNFVFPPSIKYKQIKLLGLDNLKIVKISRSLLYKLR